MDLETTQRAVIWWGKGYNVVLTPVGNQAKISWGRWIHNRQTLGQVSWMLDHSPETYTNVAIITGFNGHLVLDCDKPGEYDALVTSYPALLNTFTVKSGREGGYHIHLICDNLPDKLPAKHPLGAEVWSYGHFAQVPGSIHHSGIPYTVHTDKPFLHIASVKDVGIVEDLLTLPRKKKNDSIQETELFFFRGNTTSSITDKIKATIPASYVLGDCDFEQSGSEHLLGYCPFHEDNKRSLSIHTVSNKAKCKSPNCILSDSWHSVIDLYMIKNKATQAQAIAALAARVK